MYIFSLTHTADIFAKTALQARNLRHLGQALRSRPPQRCWVPGMRAPRQLLSVASPRTSEMPPLVGAGLPWGSVGCAAARTLALSGRLGSRHMACRQYEWLLGWSFLDLNAVMWRTCSIVFSLPQRVLPVAGCSLLPLLIWADAPLDPAGRCKLPAKFKRTPFFIRPL